MKSLVVVLSTMVIMILLGAPACAGPVGPEFRVNTYYTDKQRYPSVARLSDGSFVVIWTSSGHQDGSYDGIYGQRYSALGVRTGGEFRVNTFTENFQEHPSVAGLSGGGFVVAWTSWWQDGSHSGVYGQRFSSAGVPVGGEFRINSNTASEQSHPSVAGLTGGGFVVAWTSAGQDGSYYGVYAQRYSATGGRLGGEFRINSHIWGSQDAVSATGLSGGGFVISWSSLGQDGAGSGIYGQRYTDTGTRIGGEFRVNSFVSGDQIQPSVAGLPAGGFVITWTSSGQDGSRTGIYGQRYSATGFRAGGEFRVNSYTESDQADSTTAGLSGGGFVIAWSSSGQDGSGTGVYGQRHNASGGRVGSEFRVNSFTTNSQDSPSLVGLSNGGFIVSWTSLQGLRRPPDIFGQRFDSTPQAP